MEQGFRIAESFGAGKLIVDDRSGFAAGVPRCTPLPITPGKRELPLDLYVRIDELPIKLGYRWFPTITVGPPGELVEAVVGEICMKRSFDSPPVGRAFPDQLTQWNVDAAASTLFTRPVGLIEKTGASMYGALDPDGFHVEEVTVLYRADRGIMIVYKRFQQTLSPSDWAMFQSLVNGNMLWDPVTNRRPAPPRQRRSSYVKPGAGLVLLPEREAEMPALAALFKRELRPGDDRIEKFMWGMLKGSEPLDSPAPPASLMEQLLEQLSESQTIRAKIRAHYAEVVTSLDLKGMATLYLRALGRPS